MCIRDRDSRSRATPSRAAGTTIRRPGARSRICSRTTAMDGVHDVGGLDGFGPVDAPPSEPVFHEDWERRAFRVSMAVMGGLGVPGGRFRHSIERMDPAHY